MTHNQWKFTLFSIIFLFISLTYLSVPLYQLFCQQTGYGGTVQISNNIPITTDSNHQIQIHFFSQNIDPNLPLEFKPSQSIITVPVGQTSLAFYNVNNLSNQSITGITTYNITPYAAAKYFKKIQCFCFDEQRWNPHQIVQMPILFYIDSDILTDINTKNITEINIHYTLFNTTQL